MVKDQLFFRWSKEETEDLIKMSGMQRRFKYREVANYLTEKYKTYRSPTACRDKVIKMIAAEKKNNKLKLTELRSMVTGLVARGKRDEVIGILLSLNSKNLSEVQTKDYDKLHKLLKKC